MFIGHYSAAFAARRLAPGAPLWSLFLAVQGVDVLWALFLLLGVERARIVPGITAANPLDLYYMPYTHSLLAAVSWSAVAFFAARAAFGKPRVAAAISAAVASHWVLDLVVHRPDLPLYDDTMKVGFGLWEFPVASCALEIVLLGAAMTTALPTFAGARRTPILVLGGVMILAQVYNALAPPPPGTNVLAVMALVTFLSLAAGAAWAERMHGGSP